MLDHDRGTCMGSNPMTVVARVSSTTVALAREP
jgi:hypothetical protein